MKPLTTAQIRGNWATLITAWNADDSLGMGERRLNRSIRFLMRRDGRMWDLIPRLPEVGIEALNPMECAAGMDIAELRQRHPRQLTCYGNLSARNLLGDRAALDEELQRKIPFAVGGGFILHSDHSIPFGVKHGQYRRALGRAQELFAQARRAG